MVSTLHRLSNAGVSLEVPGTLQEAPELEGGTVCLVARAEPWPWPDAFRPNLTVEVSPLGPDRATIVQLSALTIAAQVALGAHVAACDVWPAPDGAHGRRIISIYPALNTTVVQLQFVTTCGDHAVTVSVQHAADNHEHGTAVFRHAVTSLSCEFGGAAPDPDPATMPSLDPFAAERGLELEYLGGVRASQPFQSAGPTLDEGQLDALRRGKLRRGVDASALEAAGFVTPKGRLTDVGQAAHDALSSPAREVTIQVAVDDVPGVATLHAYQRRDSTVVVATAPPGESGSGTTVDLIASQTTPIALARWLGLAPAWTFGLGDGDAPTQLLDGAVLEARLAAPAAPAPPDASPALVRMWAQPWQVATMRAGPAGAHAVSVVWTPLAGAFRLQRAGAANGGADEASLTPLPSAQYLLEVLRLGGFDVATG